MRQLTLRVRRYDGPGRWYWSLSDDRGAFIADHEASLPGSDPQWAAFTRLSRYLRRHIDGARPLSSEAGIIKWLGEWITARALGPIAPALAKRAPVTVELQFSGDIPAEAGTLLYRPWELAVVDGQPLARQGVSLVMVPPPTSAAQRWQPGEKDPVKGELRILAVFSLPSDAPGLVLREQRHELVRLVDRIAKGSRKAIELTVLQYDVDEARLRAALEDGQGWDIVHFSGHGLIDGVVLEGAAGEQHILPTRELVELLAGNRHRLKLLVLSSCNSAAAPPAESLAARFGDDETENGTGQGQRPALPALAAEAAVTLDCAVLAMRYVVDDDFSIIFGEHLYQALLGSGQPLPRALQLALAKALEDSPRPGVPPLSAGIPALFGRRCVDLSLAPPARSRPQAYNVDELKMAGFPAPADNLIGRSAVMGRASRALGRLTADGPVGVLLTGPAGIGKTACAVELAYRHERAFDRLVWYQAPAPGADISGALAGLAGQLEQYLPEFRMRAALADASTLQAFLPLLTELMETRSALIVLDGVDSLLTSAGGWRDDRWAAVTEALASHRGFSRVLLTARLSPDPLPGGIVPESVGPLSAEESVLLARRLPRLGALLRGGGGQPAGEVRRQAASALTQAAGNPADLRAIDRAAVTTADPSPEYLDLVTRWTPEL